MCEIVCWLEENALPYAGAPYDEETIVDEIIFDLVDSGVSEITYYTPQAFVLIVQRWLRAGGTDQ